MIQVITNHCIDDILINPEQYIDSNTDTVLLKVNQVFIMLGYDEGAKCYYFTLEDDVVSEDFYCHDGDLTKMFNEIMEGKGEYRIWTKG